MGRRGGNWGHGDGTGGLRGAPGGGAGPGAEAGPGEGGGARVRGGARWRRGASQPPGGGRAKRSGRTWLCCRAGARACATPPRTPPHGARPSALLPLPRPGAPGQWDRSSRRGRFRLPPTWPNGVARAAGIGARGPGAGGRANELAPRPGRGLRETPGPPLAAPAGGPGRAAPGRAGTRWRRGWCWCPAGCWPGCCSPAACPARVRGAAGPPGPVPAAVGEGAGR